MGCGLADLEACGEAAYDAAVLNMVVMDMPDISACACGLRHVLKALPFPDSDSVLLNL